MRAFGQRFGAVLLAGAAIATAAQSTAPLERRDAVLDAASAEIGRALFLRCMCAGNDLVFDAAGHPQQTAKPTDWTLAGINVLKVERKGTNAIELDGVRVAVEFAPDRREFDRHALNDEKMKLLLVDNGDAKAFERELDEVFAVGIDQRLQQAMPDLWQHYFNPKLAWPQDSLTGQTIMTPGAPGAPAGVSNPAVSHQISASYTAAASHDHVQGPVKLLMVVNAEGVPQRITIYQPLGYGLDAKAAEAMQKSRFTPAMLAGKPVAANVQVRQDFVFVP